ncbi:thiolase family protein [Nocardia sp. SC052]|uniref:thiolase family protein n=1 Tax=Nocardia sichangensis TaxID=3385975 RepID=UPI0039A22663
MGETPVYVLGVGATPVGRHEKCSFTDLVREAYLNTLDDAGSPDSESIEGVWFASTLMDFWEQRALRGQAVLGPLMEEGSMPVGLRIVNVDGGCASGSVAFNGAWSAVRQGADLALAIGVEKMNDADRPGGELLRWIEGTGNMLDPGWFWRPYHAAAEQLGVSFSPGDGRSAAMDVYAILALTHMRRYGTTVRQIAHAAAKNHCNAVGNPRAQYRFPMTVDEVLEDRLVVPPLTRAMCAPRGDAGGAILVCSERYLARQPADVRERALLVRGHDVAGGRLHATWENDRAPVRALSTTYRMADLGPGDLDIVELHDASSFAEIHLIEDIGLCARGDGGPFTASGATARDGRTPVNPSGGLVSRGHPIAATGILMLHELALQLRGEAGEIQVDGARIGLVENGGGILDLDAAVCSTTILQRVS